MGPMRVVLALGVAGILAVTACGSAEAPCAADDRRAECTISDGNPVTEIVVSPGNVVREVDIDDQKAFTICFQASAKLKNGRSIDVTNAVFWALDPPWLGSLEGPCLTSHTDFWRGGIFHVRAGLPTDALTGEAIVVVKLRGSVELDGVAATDFGGAPRGVDGAKPRIVYPLGNSMQPRNIPSMNIQFTAGGNQIFRARFASPELDYAVFFKPTACTDDECQWTVPEDVWLVVATSGAGAATKLTISGTDGSPNAPVAISDAITVAFSPDDVIGGLYYFSTSCNGIMRLPLTRDSTARKATPFIAKNSPSNPKDCAGCHAVSQDRTRIAATYGGYDGVLGIAHPSDAEVRSLAPEAIRSNFQWFNQNGTKLISNFNGELVIRDGTTGAELSRIAKNDIGPPGKQRASMPEWSHDDSRIVFVRLVSGSVTYPELTAKPQEGGDWMLGDAGEIVTMNHNGGVFSDATVIVGLGGDNEFHYYPSFSPGDDWIVFNTGTKPGDSPSAVADYSIPTEKALISYGQASSRLRLVKVTGGAPIELAAAGVGPGRTSSWPKFTPFAQRNGKLLFFTFSSKMDYGFVVKGGRRPQLWMAAIDLSRLDDGAADPSFPPFWLPFQDDKEANLLGLWVKRGPVYEETEHTRPLPPPD